MGQRFMSETPVPGGADTGIRTFEIVSNVSGKLEGGIDDWPAQMQDAAYAALERMSAQVQLPLTIVASVCDFDIDTGWYVRIVASEIVVKAESFNG